MADKTNGTTPQGGSSVTEPTGGDDVAGILNFDPFAPAKEPVNMPSGEGGEVTPSGEAKPADKSGAPDPGKTQAASAAKPAVQLAKSGAPASATTPKPQPDLEKLFKDQTDAIRSLVKSPEPTAAKETPTPPRYNVGIPPQLLEAMSSEDPAERATATHALVNGIANMVWNDVTAAIKTELGNMLQGMPQIMEAHYSTRQTQQQVYQDFYGAHTNLAKPEFQPLVLSAGAAVFKDWQAVGKEIQWGPELRDAIAEKIYSAIPALRPAATPANKGNGSPARPRFNPGSNARPSGGGAGPEAEMLAILGTPQQ